MHWSCRVTTSVVFPSVLDQAGHEVWPAVDGAESALFLSFSLLKDEKHV